MMPLVRGGACVWVVVRAAGGAAGWSPLAGARAGVSIEPGRRGMPQVRARQLFMQPRVHGATHVRFKACASSLLRSFSAQVRLQRLALQAVGGLAIQRAGPSRRARPLPCDGVGCGTA